MSKQPPDPARETAGTGLPRHLPVLTAGLVHALATPLNTALLIADELLLTLNGHGKYNDRKPAAGGERGEISHTALGAELKALQSQLLRCRHILQHYTRPTDATDTADAYILRIAGDHPMAKNRLTVSFVADGSRSRQYKDVPALRLILDNLLDNALEAAESTISVLLDERDGLSIEICDDGPGFAQLPGARLHTPGREIAHLRWGHIITRSLLQQFGAVLTLENMPAGGAKASFTISAGALVDAGVIAAGDHNAS